MRHNLRPHTYTHAQQSDRREGAAACLARAGGIDGGRACIRPALPQGCYDHPHYQNRDPHRGGLPPPSTQAMESRMCVATDNVEEAAASRANATAGHNGPRCARSVNWSRVSPHW